MRSIRVLIVDRYALFAQAFATRLRRENDLVVLPVAVDARHALALIATEHPQVVVLDPMLGSQDGFCVLDHLRKRHPGVHVIVLTAVSDVSAIVRAVRHGAVAWLPKTESADRVVQVIRHVARRGGWIPPELLGDVLRDLTAGEPGPGGVSSKLAGLTPRELEILQSMVDGLSRGEIAERFGLSAHTIRTHAQNLLGKLESHSTLEAVTLAMRAGMRPGGGAFP